MNYYWTIITYLKDGHVLTEKFGDAPVGDECRACNPGCPGNCEKCVKESLVEDET